MTNNLPANLNQNINTISDLLEKNREKILMALPKHLSVDRMLRLAIGAMRGNQKLAECSAESVVNTIIQSAQVGLEPDGVFGQAFMVPFKGEAQLVVGYKGLIDLARRSGQVVSIQAHVVYENDGFEYAYGLDDKLEHRPALAQRGKEIAVYAAAKLKDGGHAFEVLSVEEINKVRDDSSAYKYAKKNPKAPRSIWETNWPEMARKTAVRRLVKYLPISVEMQRAVSVDERSEVGLPMEVQPYHQLADQSPEAGTQARLENLKDRIRNEGSPEDITINPPDQKLKDRLMDALGSAKADEHFQRSVDEIWAKINPDGLADTKVNQLITELTAKPSPTWYTLGQLMGVHGKGQGNLV